MSERAKPSRGSQLVRVPGTIEEEVKASIDTGQASQQTMQLVQLEQGIDEKRSSDSSIPDYIAPKEEKEEVKAPNVMKQHEKRQTADFGGAKDAAISDSYVDDYESLRHSGSIPPNLMDKIDDIVQKRVKEELSRASASRTVYVSNEQPQISVFPQTFSNSELKEDEKEDNDYSQDSFPVVQEEQSNSIVIK